MIFASDLDQTMIYSPKSFRTLPGESLPPIQCVEIYDGREISFMAKSAIAKLKQIAARHYFIPVTTRTIDQYRRIFLFDEEIVPAYAVVSNGGNILINGSVDLDWQRTMAMQMAQMCLCSEDMLASFNELSHASWAGSMKMADGLFYYCIIERDRVPLAQLDSFATWAQGQHWNVSMQGRKLYLVPEVINKWSGVDYIRNLLQEKRVVTAGDSLLDLYMLQQADDSMAPCHGEIWDSYSDGKLLNVEINFTQQAGILAAEDILDYVDGFSLREQRA